jgi:hypothetical protein
VAKCEEESVVSMTVQSKKLMKSIGFSLAEKAGAVAPVVEPGAKFRAGNLLRIR